MNAFDGVPCRNCGATTLRLEWRLELTRVNLGKGYGSATEWPYCVCDTCGSHSRGTPTGHTDD